MGRTWHPEHFVCTHCQEEIGSRNFFERDGQPYCEKDYHTLFSPRCYYCNGPILDVSPGHGGRAALAYSASRHPPKGRGCPLRLRGSVTGPGSQLGFRPRPDALAPS